jgi:hypothetical protein
MTNVYKGSKSANVREQEEENAPLLRVVQSDPPGSHSPCKRDFRKEIVSAKEDVAERAIDIPECSSSASSGEDGEDNSPAAAKADPRTCRICFEAEEDPANPLISPCLCSGSSRYIHRECLQQWRTTAHRQDAYYQCEVCKFRYQYRRLWWADFLGNSATLVIGFLLLVSLLTFGLGFVPIMPAATAVQVGKVMTHIVNGVIMMAMLGIALTIAVGISRASGVNLLWFLPDPWLPGCLCLDCTFGCPLEAGIFGAECGVALLAIMVVMLIAVGFAMACYMLYGMLWLMVCSLLQRAQHMVENVTPQQHSNQQQKQGEQQEGPAAV